MGVTHKYRYRLGEWVPRAGKVAYIVRAEDAWMFEANGWARTGETARGRYREEGAMLLPPPGWPDESEPILTLESPPREEIIQRGVRKLTVTSASPEALADVITEGSKRGGGRPPLSG